MLSSGSARVIFMEFEVQNLFLKVYLTRRKSLNLTKLFMYPRLNIYDIDVCIQDLDELVFRGIHNFAASMQNMYMTIMLDTDHIWFNLFNSGQI